MHRRCIPGPTTAFRLLRLATENSLAVNAQLRLLKNSAVPATSTAAHHASVRLNSGLNDTYSVPMSVIDQRYERGLSKMFDTDHSLPSKSTIEIIRALSIYHLCSFPIFVRNGRTLYDLTSAILGHKITDGILRNTFFAHFCGGMLNYRFGCTQLRFLIAVSKQERLREI